MRDGTSGVKAMKRWLFTAFMGVYLVAAGMWAWSFWTSRAFYWQMNGYQYNIEAPGGVFEVSKSLPPGAIQHQSVPRS